MPAAFQRRAEMDQRGHVQRCNMALVPGGGKKKKKKHNFNPRVTLVNDAVNSPLPTGTYLKRTSSQRKRMPVQFAAVWGMIYSLLQSVQSFGGNLTAKQ